MSACTRGFGRVAACLAGDDNTSGLGGEEHDDIRGFSRRTHLARADAPACRRWRGGVPRRTQRGMRANGGGARRRHGASGEPLAVPWCSARCWRCSVSGTPALHRAGLRTGRVPSLLDGGTFPFCPFGLREFHMPVRGFPGEKRPLAKPPSHPPCPPSGTSCCAAWRLRPDRRLRVGGEGRRRHARAPQGGVKLPAGASTEWRMLRTRESLQRGACESARGSLE